MIKEKIKKELEKVIIGQEDVINKLLIAIFSGGHTLIIGVPGLAKTLLVSSLGKSLDLSFSRIQFTPDLMPSDITGTEIIQESKDGKRTFRFVKGPVFANLVLADEINRAPPKTQAALLEAMQERKVTFGGKNYLLEDPFFVIATQNPIEQEGTYPLPEAQLDRFMFSIKIDYPGEESEKTIIAGGIIHSPKDIKKVIAKGEWKKISDDIRSVPVSEEVLDFILRLTKLTRPGETEIPDVKKYVEWGVSPRGGQYLLLGAKARAFLDGRPTPSFKDVMGVIHPVFDHRIITNFLASADGVTPSKVVDIVCSYANKNP
ncbi:MoxR family ATPase [candidate division WOR-3 bacterium]|nr:MoxR family ATPase [candidate division WOR-3 bacterium]